MTGAPTQAELPESGQGSSQFRFIVAVGYRYWRLALSLTVVASLAFGGLGLFVGTRTKTRNIEASLELAVKRSSWKAVVPSADSGAALLLVSPAEIIKRIDRAALVEMVAKSIPPAGRASDAGVVSAAVKDGAAGFSIAEINRAFTLSEIPNTGGIVVRSRADTAAGAIQLASAVAQALVKQHEDFLERRTEEATTFVQGELEALAKDLEGAEAKEWDLLKQQGFQTYEEVAKQVREKNDALAETQAARTQALADLSQIEAELKKNHDTLPVALSQITDSLIVKLLDELEGLRKDELAMDMVYEPEFPPLQDLRAEIAEKEATVLEAVRRYEDGMSSGTNTWNERQSLRQRHTQLQLDLAKLAGRMKGLEQQTQELFTRLPEFANNSREYSQVSHEVEGARSQFNRMLERDFELKAAIRNGVGQLEQTTPVAASVLPTNRPWAVMNFVIGGMAGLLLAMGLGAMMHMMDTSIHSQEDAVRFLGRNVIGAIPKMRFARRSRKPRAQGEPEPAAGEVTESIVTVRDPQSPVSEAYRILRTNFQFATLKEHPKTLMVTSAVPGEGKTTTAINFGVVMAASGARVLVVDCDLRRPNVHRMLHLERSPGLVEALTQGVDIHSVIQGTRIENLHVVPSGQLPQNPSELLGSEAMRALIAQLGQEFDVVICDAPSVIVVTDAIVLAKEVQSTVMLVSVNNARRETIKQALDLLDTAQGQVAGVVLNGLEPTQRRYYYYYYYSNDGTARQRRRWYHP